MSLTYGIIAIGNPGAGKSSLLNALAGEILFKSGVSFGGGLTYQLDERSNGNGHFIDTPGLADEELRKKAGEAISEVLKRGGRYKVLFFVRERSGRVIVEDVATMKIVLQAAPELGSDYGIIVNQVPMEIKEGLMDEGNKRQFVSRLFYGVDERARCPPSCLYILEEIKALKVKENVLVPLERIANGEFASFVYVNVPDVKLTAGVANDIDTDNYDAMMEKVNKMVQEVEKSRKEQDKLMKQLLQQQRDHDSKMKEMRHRNKCERESEIRAMTVKMDEMQNTSRAKPKEQFHVPGIAPAQRELVQLKHIQEMESRPPVPGFFSRLVSGVCDVGAAVGGAVKNIFNPNY